MQAAGLCHRDWRCTQVPVKETDTGRLQGRVVDESGEPVEGACLVLAKPEEFDPRQALRNPKFRTGADGRFDIERKRASVGTGPWDSAELQSLFVTATNFLEQLLEFRKVNSAQI